MSVPKYKVGDKVVILDGSKIENYAGVWAGNDNLLVRRLMSLDESMAEKSMDAMVGKVCTIKHSMTLGDGRIAYQVEESKYRFDERGLEPIDKHRADTEAKRSQVQRFKVGDRVIGNKRASSEYSITKEGWRGIIVDVISKDIVKDSECDNDSLVFHVDPDCFDLDNSPAGFNGKVVCTLTYYSSFTRGKIYEFKNGSALDNYGNIIVGGSVLSVDDLNRRCLVADFIEVVEE